MTPSRCLLPILLLGCTAFPAAAAEMFGDGYKPCGDKASTLEIVDCTTAKARAWDARLNAAYAALQQVVDPAQREPLRAAQRAWIQFRDANCGFYGAANGTIRQVQSAECVRAMTEDRARELDQAARP